MDQKREVWVRPEANLENELCWVTGWGMGTGTLTPNPLAPKTVRSLKC